MLDPNGDFNSPCYDDYWQRLNVFEGEFGVVDEYFIELQYYIMREAYVSRRGSPLDLNITHYDDGGGGEAIFRDISSAERALLASRNYVVVEEQIDTQTSDFGDIFHIREVYGYAPDKTFVKYESVVANSYGWVKSENSFVGDVEYDRNWGCFKISDGRALKVGDEVSFEMIWPNGQARLEPATVFAVDGNFAYTNPTTGRAYVNNSGAYADTNVGLYEWWVLYPAGSMLINGVRVGKYTSFRAYTRTKKKDSGQVVSLAMRQTRFMFEPPAVLEQAYCPRDANGVAEEVFSERTAPTVGEHLVNVRNGALVLLEDETIEPELFHGLYKVTKSYVPAK